MLSVFVVVAIHSVLGSFTTWLNGERMGLGAVCSRAWGATASWARGGVQGPHTSPPKGSGTKEGPFD